MCELVHYYDAKFMIGFPQFCAFLTNCFTQSAQNFKVVSLIVRKTLWQEFMMHHAKAIEEKSEQNLHIWPNLAWFFRSWLFWTLPFEWLSFGCNVIAVYPWFVTSYDVFEQIVERCQHLLSNVYARLSFAQNLAILKQSFLPHVSWLKHP